MSWLKSHKPNTVRLDWQQAALTLTCEEADSKTSTITVPAIITGTPPVIAFESSFLAKAMEIGQVLRFSDEMSPLLTVGPGGQFGVVMPKRCTVPARSYAPAVAA